MRRLPGASWPRRARALALLLAFLLAACDLSSVTPPVAERATTNPANPTATPALPVVTPSPPPPPAPDLLARALDARAIGEYDAAAADLSTLVNAYPQAPEVRPARYFLGESFARRRRWSSAVAVLAPFVDSQTQDDYTARALFWLARAHEEAGSWQAAADAYGRYTALHTVLEPYARLRRAAVLDSLDQDAEAADGYEAVAASDIDRGARAGAYEKAIALRYKLGQRDKALALYEPLLKLADDPGYRARLLAGVAALADEVGDAGRARAARREIAERAPATSQALEATNALLADPQGGLAPAVAAAVYDAHARTADAIAQYTAAISATSTLTDSLELRRKRALAQRAAGDSAGALAELAAVAAAAPNAPVGRQAQLDWVQTRGQAGETQAAIDGYRQFAAAYPDDPLAPEALSRAAILLDRLGDAAGAAQQRRDLGARYPASEQGQDALDAAGRYWYNAGQLAEARDAWEALAGAASGVLAARGAYWAGVAAQAGQDAEAARRLFAQAAAEAPDSYYGARAAEQLGRDPTGDDAFDAETTPAEWRAAEDWIASWDGKPAYHLDEQGYPEALTKEGAVQRALALTEVGLPADATAEWNTARRAAGEDPAQLYLLARYAAEHGAVSAALRATMALKALAPDDGAGDPVALERLLYPTPYSDVVVAQARVFNVDPLALYALLRQESVFDPDATSWAGAMGLAQVMPETAQGIASRLKVADFDPADLHRPSVSIRFGAYYLSRQIAAMEGSLPGALAAYNGGPGNATRWAGGTQVANPDAFVEAIDYPETSAYVKYVYGNYGAYRRLYASPQ